MVLETYQQEHMLPDLVLLSTEEFLILEMCHPRCACENWKGYVVKHNCVN